MDVYQLKIALRGISLSMANYQSRCEYGPLFFSNVPFSVGVLAFSMTTGHCIAVDFRRSDLAQWTSHEERVVIVVQCLVFCLQNNGATV